MQRLLGLVILGVVALPTAAADPSSRSLVSGLKNPRSVSAGDDGRVYVSVAGEPGRVRDGAVVVIKDGKAEPLVHGLEEPSGLVAFREWLYVAERKKVWRVDRKGKAEVFVSPEAFPAPPRALRDLTVDVESGALYVGDAGDDKGGGVIYRIDPKGKVSRVRDAKQGPALQVPDGLVLDGASHLLVLDAGSGELVRLKLADGSVTKLADGLGGGGLAWDKYGRLYVTDRKAGRVLARPRPGVKLVPLATGLQAPAGLCLAPSGQALLVVDAKAGTVTEVPARVPGFEVDESPLRVESAVAFPDLKWSGWTGEENGKLVPLRPIVLTHAGDGSNRVFVATQHGVIHVFPNDQQAKQTKVFLDIQKQVSYDDKQNEEGFLGFAIHPQYRKNGEFFVFYTVRKPKLVNVLSRFRVSKDDPDRADPASEEELLRISRPYWNHDGGTVCFGPDGFLYLALGDGGAANDPHDNGQDLSSLLGKVLRLDVNRRDGGKAYAIPRDNPFVDRPGARPEIWAYGLRNVWRMAFDRKTGDLWAGEVGQNLYEEICLIRRGGNYGWNRRESLHPFGSKGVGHREDMTDPIWEYHHDVGKSITGGTVYRGQRLSELAGAYLYADYVSGKIWALRYDADKQRVVANHPIRSRSLPILSFGEDEKGEVYYLTYTPTGQGVYWFVKSGANGR